MDTKSAALNVWASFKSRDRAKILDALTDDVEWIAPKDNATAIALGVTDHMIGKDAIANFILDDLRRLFSNGLDIEPITVTVEGNRAVFEQMQKADLSNGRRYENAYVFIFEMEGHKVHRIREYMDTWNGYKMVFGNNTPDRIVG
ncbi:MAG: nuclear transport factor 2 family protein [Hyphomicrobiaceae bacterium]|nr:nuclear transport factor 2 family protein [Hyphomicrobiaceae bacterium]